MATVQDQLAEAQAAYHDLLLGKAVARCRDANGEEIQFAQANRSALSAYIASLQAQIGNGGCTGPMRPFFL